MGGSISVAVGRTSVSAPASVPAHAFSPLLRRPSPVRFGSVGAASRSLPAPLPIRRPTLPLVTLVGFASRLGPMPPSALRECRVAPRLGRPRRRWWRCEPRGTLGTGKSLRRCCPRRSSPLRSCCHARGSRRALGHCRWNATSPAKGTASELNLITTGTLPVIGVWRHHRCRGSCLCPGSPPHLGRGAARLRPGSPCERRLRVRCFGLRGQSAPWRVSWRLHRCLWWPLRLQLRLGLRRRRLPAVIRQVRCNLLSRRHLRRLFCGSLCTGA